MENQKKTCEKYKRQTPSLFSSIGCETECASEKKKLCDSTSMSECPHVHHVVVKKSKGSESNSSCSSSSSDCDEWSVIHCESPSNPCYDEKSCKDSTECEIITPVAPCNIANKEYQSSDSSTICEECTSDVKNCHCNEKKKTKHTQKKVIQKPSKCSKCRYSKDRCLCTGNGKNKCIVKGRCYKVKFESKVGHPQENRIFDSEECISIDAGDGTGFIKGSAIHLTRGNTYKFNISEENASVDGSDFYFTKDMQGGVSGKSSSVGFVPMKLSGSPDPINSGSFAFTVTEDFPSMFYYNSTVHSNMGGLVFVHRRKC